MSKKDPARKTRFEPGSGNVFNDLGLAEPEEALARARLADAIEEVVRRRGLTQTQAAEIIGVDQPTVSKVMNGRLDGFSQERLMRYLTALGAHVEIVVHPAKDDEEGRVTVSVGEG